MNSVDDPSRKLGEVAFEWQAKAGNKRPGDAPALSPPPPSAHLTASPQPPFQSSAHWLSLKGTRRSRDGLANLRITNLVTSALAKASAAQDQRTICSSPP